MLHPIQRKRYQKRFSTIEASFRIEGMDPSGDPVYQQAKARVLAGDFTPKQALSFVVQQSASHRNQVAAVSA